jgi:hypothetical protein
MVDHDQKELKTEKSKNEFTQKTKSEKVETGKESE